MTQVGETEVMGGNVRDIVNRLSRDLGTRGQFSIPQQNQERRAPSASAAPPQPALFIVTYAYTASQSDELTLTVGDTIELISDVEDGWSRGKSKSTGSIGMFPTNFVTAKPVTAPTSTTSSTTSSRPKTSDVVMRAEPKAIERTPSTVLELKPTAEPSKSASFGGAPASVSTESAPEKTKEMARVKFVYKPQHEDELALTELDLLINITNKNCGDAGWFEGELNGKKGLFPDNFVELVQVPLKTESGAKFATVNSSRQLNFVAHKPPPLNPPQPAVPPKPAKISTVDSPPPASTTITSSSSSATVPTNSSTNPFANPSTTMPIATTSTSTPQKNNFAALRDKMSANLKVVAPEQVSSVQLKPAEQRERASSMESGDAVVDNQSDQITELQHITKNRARPPKNRPMSMVMNRNRSSDESPSGRLSSPTVTPTTTTNTMSTSMFVPSVAKEVVIPPANSSPFKSVAPPSSANKPALRPIISNSIGDTSISAANSNDAVVIRKVASPEGKSEGTTSSSTSSEFVSRSEYDALLDRFRALESRVLSLEKSQKSHF